MEDKKLSLLMTDKGLQRMKTLIAEAKPLALEVAIGDGDQLPDKSTIALAHECLRTIPSVLTTLEDKQNAWHINAYFPPDSELFDVTEIGLFISEANTSDVATLLGIYFDKTLIAKKTAKTDLLIDMVIDLRDYFAEDISIHCKDYQPRFHMPLATATVYGAVRFANLEDIKNKTPHLALSTDHLGSFMTPSSLKLDSWEMHYTAILDEGIFEPLGLFCLNERLYGLLIEEKKKDSSASQFMLIRYHLKEKELSKTKIVSNKDSFVFGTSYSGGYQNDKISWLLLKHPGISPDAVWLLTVDLAKKEEWFFSPQRLAISRNKEGQTANFLGSPCFYNNNGCMLGGLAKAARWISVGHKDKEREIDSSSLLLSYARKRPLVHVIQDKIYCLGGGSEGASLLEICRIDFKDKQPLGAYCFVPEDTVSLDIRDTMGLTSCVLRGKIYLFKPTDYYQSSEKLEFYSYNYLSNRWQTHVLPNNKKDILLSKQPLSGKAISIGDAVYLVCSLAIEDKTELAFLKFSPS